MVEAEGGTRKEDAWFEVTSLINKFHQETLRGKKYRRDHLKNLPPPAEFASASLVVCRELLTN